MPVAMYAARTVSGNQPVMRRLTETSAQTFKNGVPVTVTSGAVVEWSGNNPQTNIIAGIAKEAGQNLTNTGVPDTLNYGSVPNQPSAVNIPVGAPISDGLIAVEMASQDSVFWGQVLSGQTPVVGTNYGMTKDGTTNYWYVDTTKTGANAVCTVVALDENDDLGVYFTFIPAAIQMVA